MKQKRAVAVQAVRSGASVTDTAREFGIGRATLHRWVRAFDPARPAASLRPAKRGPKGPRWDAAAFDLVTRLIATHPDLWGRHRVAQALAERGVIMSEATVSRMLPVARERLVREREREEKAERGKEKAERVRRSREVAAMVRRDEREAEKRARRDKREAEWRALWLEWLRPMFAPGLSPEERFRRAGEALNSVYKIRVKDLTPELMELADWYYAYLEAQPVDVVGPSETWRQEAARWLRILKSPEEYERGRTVIEGVVRGAPIRAVFVDGRPGRGPNPDHLRVSMLNHLRRNYHKLPACGSPLLPIDPKQLAPLCDRQ
jgi:transposase